MVHLKSERTGYLEMIWLTVAGGALELGPSCILRHGPSRLYLVLEGQLAPQLK